jgi:hypothetical protein
MIASPVTGRPPSNALASQLFHPAVGGQGKLVSGRQRRLRIIELWVII